MAKTDLFDLIDNYKAEQDRIAYEQLKAKAKEKQDLISKILSLQPRISKLLKLGKKCEENGVFNHGFTYLTSMTRENGYFYTDSWAHRLGFANKCECLGIYGGGACDYNLITDGTEVHVSGSDDMHVLRRFVNEFDKFEEDLIAYITKKCSK